MVIVNSQIPNGVLADLGGKRLRYQGKHILISEGLTELNYIISLNGIKYIDIL